MRATGTYVTTTVAGEAVRAFVPEPLPPTSPRLDLTGPRAARLMAAEHALARLAIAGAMVPSLDWFLYAYVRKEAVLSSQIEGTQASLVDVLEYEASARASERVDDVKEICNYVDALTFARQEIARPRGLPLSTRLLNEAHRRLLRGVRGRTRQPGELRRSQNWIGGTRPGHAVFVPPPPDRVPALLGALESYVHAPDRLPPLVRIGLAHVQFETIHPYLHGNGRIGRLFVTLLLEHWKLLPAPVLYLSLFFKQNRAEYDRLLTEVRARGDWEAWLDFFFEGVATISDEAIATARKLFARATADRERLLAASNASVMSVRLLELLPRHPVVTIPSVVKLLQTTKPTAGKAVEVLEGLGILAETTGRRRDRTFSYKAYLDQLRTGTELEA
jgi:Fic family protein